MQLTELFLSLDEGKHDPHIFKAVFVVGPPGAGKDTVIHRIGLPAVGLKMLDIDETLLYLKRARPEHADYYKSLDTTVKRMSLLQHHMLGLLINTTGRDAGQLMKLNRNLKNRGYDTFLLFVEIDKEVALRRIAHREKFAKHQKDFGRKVDLDYFNQAYSESMENLSFYEYMFDDQFAIVSNNADLINEDISPEKLLDVTLKIAAKKVNRFLRKPLTPKAREMISSSSQLTATN